MSKNGSRRGSRGSKDWKNFLKSEEIKEVDGIENALMKLKIDLHKLSRDKMRIMNRACMRRALMSKRG